MKMNNEQINETSYYRLPCGRFLEDFIWWKKLNFAEGSALKYQFRAGRKDGESMDKEFLKRGHYIDYIADRECRDFASVSVGIDLLMDEAMAWDGKEN